MTVREGESRWRAEISAYLDHRAYVLECCDSTNEYQEAKRIRGWISALASSETAKPELIEDGPFKGLPKPRKVPDGYVLVDEKSFKIILDVLTEEQVREICMKEGERFYLNREVPTPAERPEGIS